MEPNSTLEKESLKNENTAYGTYQASIGRGGLGEGVSLRNLEQGRHPFLKYDFENSNHGVFSWECLSNYRNISLQILF